MKKSIEKKNKQIKNLQKNISTEFCILVYPMSCDEKKQNVFIT